MIFQGMRVGQIIKENIEKRSWDTLQRILRLRFLRATCESEGPGKVWSGKVQWF